MTSKKIQIRAIDVDNGTPRDTELHAAVQAYAEREFGQKINFSDFMRVWAAIETEEGRDDYFEVIGLTGIRSAPDCSMFHITPPTQDKEGLRQAEVARDAAVYRMASYIEDLGMKGAYVLIYVSAEAQRYWAKYLDKLGAEPANRFKLTI